MYTIGNALDLGPGPVFQLTSFDSAPKKKKKREEAANTRSLLKITSYLFNVEK